MYKKQPTVEMSTAEAEYQAITEVLQQVIHARNLGTTFCNDKGHVVLATEKHPALDMLKALGNTRRSKYIDPRHNFLKEQVRTNNVEIRHIKSAEQEADIFKKPLGRIKYVDSRKRIGAEKSPI